jgi:membrane protein DedA with SNARE-associated domain
MIAQALFASIAIILLSFVSEDAATISSALSIFGGPINWPLGFAACFAGIWLGDLGLYSLARCLGKPILQSRWVARFADPAAIERCQKTFNERGAMALLASRFVPGTRLPTYLAAGLLSMPVARFAIVTAIAALLWIGGIFAIANLLGSQTLIGFSFLAGKIAGIVFTAVFLGGSVFSRRGLLNGRVNDVQIGRLDVVPTDIDRVFELNERPSAHVDRLHLAGQPFEPPQFGNSRIDLHKLVGVLPFKRFD